MADHEDDAKTRKKFPTLHHKRNLFDDTIEQNNNCDGERGSQSPSQTMLYGTF